MDHARADALAARHRLSSRGWITARNETFRHLPPPELSTWLPDAADDRACACEASPLAGAGWTLHPIGAGQGRVEARWLDATDPAQRAALFAGVTLPHEGDAAPFAWAHRAGCRQGLRLRIGGAPAELTPPDEAVCLHLSHQPRRSVESPALVIELAPGERVVLLETHERPLGAAAPDGPTACRRSVAQNLRVHVKLGAGATLQHVRVVAPGPRDDLAHHVQVTLGAGARYEQALIASGSHYHLQRTVLDLAAPRAVAQVAGALFAAGTALDGQVDRQLDCQLDCQVDCQVDTRQAAAHTHSAVEALALASGAARAVINAHTRIEAGSDGAVARQRLSAMPVGGQPRLVLRPHLEILHDQVQATHGATWGALPEDALFYARQRGLSEAAARALIVEGLLVALLTRGVGEGVLQLLAIEALLHRVVARQLAAQADALQATEAHHG